MSWEGLQLSNGVTQLLKLGLTVTWIITNVRVMICKCYLVAISKSHTRPNIKRNLHGIQHVTGLFFGHGPFGLGHQPTSKRHAQSVPSFIYFASTAFNNIFL